MGRHLPHKLKSLLVTGGGNPKPMEQALAAGVDIVTGTPGVICCLSCAPVCV